VFYKIEGEQGRKKERTIRPPLGKVRHSVTTKKKKKRGGHLRRKKKLGKCLLSGGGTDRAIGRVWC